MDDNWEVLETEDAGVHVVPLREDHDLTTVCACGPSVSLGDENGPYGSMLVTHNSFDGREAVEWAEAILND